MTDELNGLANPAGASSRTPSLRREQIETFMATGLAKLTSLTALHSLKTAMKDPFVLDPAYDKFPESTIFTRAQLDFKPATQTESARYYCFAGTRTISALLNPQNPLYQNEFKTPDHEVKSLMLRIRGQILGSPNHSVPVKNSKGESIGTLKAWVPISSNDTELAKFRNELKTMPLGTVFFMETPEPSHLVNGFPIASHAAVKTKLGSNGGILGFGAENPSVKHIIGKSCLTHPIVDQQYGTQENRWAGFAHSKDKDDGWYVTVAYIPNRPVTPSFVDVRFLGSDLNGATSLVSVRDWLLKNSDVVKTQGMYPEHLLSILFTANPGRVVDQNAPLSKLQISPNLPVRIPRDWLPSSVKQSDGVDKTNTFAIVPLGT